MVELIRQKEGRYTLYGDLSLDDQYTIAGSFGVVDRYSCYLEIHYKK